MIRRNVDHALDLVGRFAAAPDTRLVVFPEFFLQGSRLGRLPQLFPVAGINLRSSPHIERLARFAQQHKVHLCGAVLEIDDDWPGHLFNTAFILDDRGELIHRYRKIQCADVFGFMDTTPGSILDRYLERYGYEALFPVADTRLGRLATAICFDMNFPELHRALAQRGAEVLLHPTAEPHNIRRRAWENGRQVRAWENTMYIASAGLGGEYWEPGRRAVTVLARAFQGRELRRLGAERRRRPGARAARWADRPAGPARGARRRRPGAVALGRARRVRRRSMAAR